MNCSISWFWMISVMSNHSKSLSLMDLSKNSFNFLIQKNPEKENIWRISFIDYMLNSSQEEKWSEEPWMTISILWFIYDTNSMEFLNFLISMPLSLVDLQYHSEKNMLNSSKKWLFLFIKFKPVNSTMNNCWDAQCFSFQRIHPWLFSYIFFAFSLLVICF